MYGGSRRAMMWLMYIKMAEHLFSMITCSIRMWTSNPCDFMVISSFRVIFGTFIDTRNKKGITVCYRSSICVSLRRSRWIHMQIIDFILFSFFFLSEISLELLFSSACLNQMKLSNWWMILQWIIFIAILSLSTMNAPNWRKFELKFRLLILNNSETETKWINIYAPFEFLGEKIEKSTEIWWEYVCVLRESFGDIERKLRYTLNADRILFKRVCVDAQPRVLVCLNKKALTHAKYSIPKWSMKLTSVTWIKSNCPTHTHAHIHCANNNNNIFACANLTAMCQNKEHTQWINLFANRRIVMQTTNTCTLTNRQRKEKDEIWEKWSGARARTRACLYMFCGAFVYL